MRSFKNYVGFLVVGSKIKDPKCEGLCEDSWSEARGPVRFESFGILTWESPKIRGTLLWCPYNKRPTI